MGQEQISKLSSQFKEQNELSSAANDSLQMIKSALEMAQHNLPQPISKEQLMSGIFSFLENRQASNKRRRSFDICQQNKEEVINKQSSQNNSSYLTIQHEIESLEASYHEICSNIIEIMATQKVYKIRQHFRKLILKLLGLQNFLVYFIHEKGRLEYHDFQSNYITDILQIQRCLELESIMKDSSQEGKDRIYDFFHLQEQKEKWRHDWGELMLKEEVKVCYMWKGSEGREHNLNKRLVEKISNICMISSIEEETTIIQSYSKDLLDIFQILISQNESSLSSRLNKKHRTLRQFEEELNNEQKVDMVCKKSVVRKVREYEQCQFSLLQNIRMYKKYVCQENKIFMDFNAEAELVFLSNNYQHKISRRIMSLYESGSLFIENIFREDQCVNEFLKKALQKKVKNNKLYELDYETKVRVQYSDSGRVLRFHIIFQEFEKSSNHSSNNLYTSSSTKILSSSSGKKSESDKSFQPPTAERRPAHSTLLNSLQKQNPGIINSGWINLFMKEDNLVRKNTHFKNKIDKSYLVKRPLSLRKGNETMQERNPNHEQILPFVNIESIDLNLLSFQEEYLEPMVIKVFKKLQFFNQHNINLQYFENFLSDLHNGYQIHNNPFHNFAHGVNVMHTCYLLSQTAKSKQILSPFKIFTIVLSGLCHDIGHTGFTNLFEIASQSKKAILYNDASPLQNYHASYSFELLRKPENNFLQNLAPEEWRAFRKHFISNILYTDIKEHFPLLKKFNSYLKEEIPKNEEYLNVFSGVIIHTSDFGGSAKQFDICKQWSLKVNLQFSNQYKKEGELGLPLTPYMKDLTSIGTLSKNEGGFLKIIVLPLYEVMDEFNLNDLSVKRLKQYVQKNIKAWQKIKEESLCQ